ncbi:hypothetical protein KTE28_03720 [Burkholderia multivorans]|uniref:hypothetical protein n=1 Tax=Burkholderia multivorans TaxID=87883 RepID=UPI001C2620B4|nr:hypothetical protein [Burkholderia multivorans]MBU9373441.1 hypothetical protein [Burkholderia multivorans]
MNYQHIESDAPERAVQRGMSAAQQKKAEDARRVESLNRLTRYPSWVAVIATGVALVSAAVHLLR